eukprot:TRINITY_DN9422_c0_g1_i4.p1 TRINITY_DN9422_c0_g1~~TRINITY_DN9422_c0_g1_i4.p1  ORF type:complete len:266 (-),score=40.00 TRINITY_DN9422_c0_g1_i4:58-855(-)
MISLRKGTRLLRRRWFSNSNNNDLPNFPFRFGGLTRVEIDTEKAEELAHHLPIVIGSPSVIEGFELAYKATLDALKHHDTQFFLENCEHKLRLRVNEAFQDLEESQKSFHLIEGDQCTPILTAVRLINGITQEREEEPRKPLRTMDAMYHFEDVYYERQQRGVLLHFMQVEVLFKTNSILKLEAPSEGEALPLPEYHKILFESYTDPQNPREVMRRILKTKGLFQFSLTKFFENINFTAIRETMFIPGYRWKIADIDDALEGNPL